MASKKNFSITTPRGSVFTEVTANGSVPVSYTHLTLPTN